MALASGFQLALFKLLLTITIICVNLRKICEISVKHTKYEVTIPMKSTPPLIGIPCRHDISTYYAGRPVNAQNDSYMTAVSRAGGIPFLMPMNLPAAHLRTLYDLAAGILLSGGGDIEPSLYNQPPRPTLGDVQPDRDHEEITISRWAGAEGKPLLAICRGIQVIAVAAGGTLYQDIPSQIPQATLHRYAYNNEENCPYEHLAHEVELTPSCRLAQIVQTTRFWVNSLHHQAVDSVPLPLQIAGRSPDGVVEVVEHPDHPFYCGVQWHPEVLVAEHDTARRIFEAFVQACTV